MKRTIPIAKPILGRDEIEAVKKVFESGILVQGERTRRFEREFAEYINVEHAVAMANGTLALDAALKALKINPGDEIITPAFSFIASSNCVLYQGAKPVFADINLQTFNIDPADVVEKITSKTRAIIAVHLFGQPAEMDRLREISEANKIALVEDAAQAHGADYHGQKVGGLGNIGCFSFYATKNMTTGEGGIITTDSNELDRRSRLLRNHGMTRKYHHALLGYNYRISEATAAVGSVQLRKLDKLNEKRRENAELLTCGIKKISGLTAPYIRSDVRHVFHQYVMRVEEGYCMERDKLGDYLRKRGVGVAVHYPSPIYKQPFYRGLGYRQTNCPVAEDVSKQVLSLPVHPSVTEDEIEYMLALLSEL